MKSYINYVKRQHKHVQDIHAVVIATILTLIVAIVYLQYEYQIFYPEYKRIEEKKKDNSFEQMFGINASSVISTDTITNSDAVGLAGRSLGDGVGATPHPLGRGSGGGMSGAIGIPWASNTKTVLEYNPWQAMMDIWGNSKKIFAPAQVEYRR